MKVSLAAALGLTFAMGLVIFFCRLFPFLMFREKPKPSGETEKTATARSGEAETAEKSRGGPDSPGKTAPFRRELFLNFVEKLAPPAAMTVLAFNAIAGSFKADLREGGPVLAAAALTALIHLWKRNPLFSIFGGTAGYMILERIMVRLY
jgi:branched-subunit amino acid transport protein AzlD